MTHEEEKEPQIVCSNGAELIRKYPAVKESLEFLIEDKCKYYNEHPFKEKEKKIFVQQIKEDIILLNQDYEKDKLMKEVFGKEENIRLDKLSKREKVELPEEEIIDFTYIVKTKHRDGSETEIEKVSIEKITDYLLNNFHFKTIYGTKSERVYNYKNGIWVLKGRALIKTQVESLLNTKATTHIVNEVYEKIKRRTEIDSDDFNKVEVGLVCLKNGIYNLKEKKFHEHNPQYNFKSKLPIVYNPKLDCPDIKKFFGESLYEEHLNFIQEWIGFNLYNVYFEKNATIFFGEKDTGKTIALDLISHFIGEENTASLSLQNISHGKTFDLLDLKDKFANIHDDLGDKDINDVGGFKIATGGGWVTGEEKFGDRVRFKPYAKLTYATNKIPAIKDVDDEAYFSRWFPIPFDNQILKKDQDKFLLKKLTTEEEISGLFNWALIGFNRLIKNNGFSFYKSPIQIKDIMQRSSHHLVKFAQDCLKEKIGYKITKELMFFVYLKWCKNNDVTNFTKDKLGKNLSRFVTGLDSRVEKERYWINFDFTELPLRYDGLDTFLKNMRDKKEGINIHGNLNTYNKKKGVLPEDTRT